jgi:hypothetical protein
LPLFPGSIMLACSTAGTTLKAGMGNHDAHRW